MRVRLLRVAEPPAVFRPLIEAMTEEGMRCGWLDLSADVAPPPELEAAAELGVLRAVAAAGPRAVAVKPVAGRFVLRDLLREHFLGCALVLVHGEVEAPSLRSVEGGHDWIVETADGPRVELTTEELARRLRRPRWLRS